MLNFTVGPVTASNEICEIGSQQVPYFRTEEFSKLMLENEKLVLNFANAPNNSRCVFITGSGSASMEASIVNSLSIKDKVLVINSGSFGKRFVDILNVYNIPNNEICIPKGRSISSVDLAAYDKKNYTAFIVNIHETSTGVLHNLDIISNFCRKNNLFLIVDAISSFLADEINMLGSNIDILIAGSQKALAVPPGVSFLILSPRALDRIKTNKNPCFYLDLNLSLTNQERGQTPFTPAVLILIQINARLKEIDKNGGVNAQINRTYELAKYFRKSIIHLPFKITSSSLSNAVTPLHPINCSAYDLFLLLKDKYNIWVCPNGGELKDYIFRVGHIGNLHTQDYDILLKAFEDLRLAEII